MVLTYKVRLEPNNKQAGKFRQFAGAARHAYNWALEREKEAYELGNCCGLEIDRDLNASLNLCRYGTVSSTGINVCGVLNQTKVATAKSDTMKQKANIKSIE